VNANPTTGYTWEVGFDQSLLKLVKRYTPSGTGMIGAGGVESFEFEGMKAGETEIYLNYKRSFEPNNPALETKNFKVTVK
jgi:predicted secreted protein